MSKYKIIQTEFRDRQALAEALIDVGVPFEEHVGGAALYGYQGDERPERANFIVRRQHVGLSSNDFGLEWDAATKSYRAHISAYDQQQGYGPRLLNRIKQRYAVRHTIALARAKGMTITEQKDDHGVIRLKLAGYRR